MLLNSSDATAECSGLLLVGASMARRPGGVLMFSNELRSAVPEALVRHSVESNIAAAAGGDQAMISTGVPRGR